jgi:glycosyltransferase involved in cell wall biosynthesis
MKSRALYVGAFMPDEAARHAGGQAAHQNRAELLRQRFDVTSLICSTERLHGPLLAGETFFHQTPLALLLGWLRNILRGSTFGLLAWPLLDTRANAAFERRLRRELSQGGYEVVFVDFTQTCLPVERSLRGIARRPQVRLCAHDIYVQKLLRKPGWLSHTFFAPVVRIEREVLRCADIVITLSPKDKALVAGLYDCAVVEVKPFSAPRWVARVRRDEATIARHEVLFFANFERPENLEALTWFIRDVLAPVTRRFPDFRLIVAGAGSDTVRILADPRHIHRTGFVEDPSAIYSRCAFAVAPLAQGAGVKFKVLEALAAGVAVLGTAIAFEGIAPTPLVIESSRDTFAARLIELLAR